MKDISKVFAHVFSQPEGQKILDSLEKSFPEKVDPHTIDNMHYYVGQRSVLHHINKLIEKGKKE